METRRRHRRRPSELYPALARVGPAFRTRPRSRIRRIARSRKPASLKRLLVAVRANVARSGHSHVPADRLAWHNSGRVLLDGASHDFMLWALFVLRQWFIFD